MKNPIRGPLREPIVKSHGTAKGERALDVLAERSFLNLWTYSSPYRDQRNSGVKSGDGKELCDLLVVRGDKVIIFSEKKIEWPSGDPSVSWSRWFKRAISSSVKQAQGSAR